MASEPQIDFSMILASSVHDMKNSLAMLLGTLDQFSAGCSGTCAASGKLEQIHYQGQRLSGDLVQLLTLYKMQHQQYTPKIDEYDVGDFLQESVAMHESVLRSRGITIEAQCPPDLRGYFDRDMIASIINNVINNACKYTKSLVRVTGIERDGYTLITVDDDGAGYPAHMLEQSGAETRPINVRTGSTSLGLYFAGLIARAHTNKGRHGSIRCSNDGIDGGGRFSLFLP